ncbi:hypothetical protein V5O48_009358 [Marasmius crinis-equi]|uniref:Uncharacterized protein n=1 Tax=Marasmius crinis-equi TaxID=585013 RepID=A0ABR3FBH9_9AGAR
MVNLEQIHFSNASISSSLPSGLIAVFVGATSGIGEYSLKAFAKHARRPKIYFVGRSEEAATRIVEECNKLNKGGEYVFIKSDVSLIRNVDKVCEEIKQKEKQVDLLFQSQGTLNIKKQTEEGLPVAYALSYASRFRFTQNLLPLLRETTSLKRVVTVFAGTKEGSIDESDWLSQNKASMGAAAAHMVSILTLSLEILAKEAPDLSFVHSYPGYVQSQIARDLTPEEIKAMMDGAQTRGPVPVVSPDDCGEIHVYLSTSMKYPSSQQKENKGVSVGEGVEVARGTDGKVGSGVYTVDQDGESASSEVEALLANFRNEGVVDRLKKHTEEVFERIVKLS